MVMLSVKQINYIVNTQKFLEHVLKLDIRQNVNEVSVKDIHKLIGCIAKNSKEINSFLKKKKMLDEKITEHMDFFVSSKNKLSARQMKYFKDYMEISQYEGSFVKTNLKEVNNEETLKEIKSQLWLSDGDYNSVYENLKNIVDYQYNALYSLKRIVNKANRVLKVF